MFSNMNMEGNSEGGEFLPFMQQMMQSLLSKEILYPALKDIVDKYPAWLEENKSKLEPSEFDRFSKQKQLMDQVCVELEKESEVDTPEIKKQRFDVILDLMQKPQDHGQQPGSLLQDHHTSFKYDFVTSSIFSFLLDFNNKQPGMQKKYLHIETILSISLARSCSKPEITRKNVTSTAKHQPTHSQRSNREQRINENMAAVKNSPCNENMAAVENSPSNNAALQLTSEQNKEVEFVYFDSPNVTKERGSSRKRKSSRRLRVIEEETDVLPYVSRMEEERKINGIIHFRSVLKSETERLESLCTSWEEISNTTPDLPQDANGTINAAIGQTKLLISKKFCKFRGLIDKCESGPTSEGEPILTCTDLEGFWDLVYLEVEKVDGSF
ncbi:hypothetical protein L9F63_026344 [Diploptera punctata]|uniref:Peroxin-19 n=1 Tax=Diploptera punctata TaxID=6984 RepID=A0AAD8AJW4_DIPPU|nr:hypothetical protein L9F63_026344 [Diploptera punctata]